MGEKARAERERQEKEKKEAAAEKKRLEEEERKKAALAALNVTKTDRPERKKGRGTERDKKKKALAERRKPLNIDHLDVDKLKKKAKDLWEHLKKIEEQRFDLDIVASDDKYNLATLRSRVNLQSEKIGKQRRVGKLLKR